MFAQFVKNFFIGIKRISFDLFCIFIILFLFLQAPEKYVSYEAKMAFIALLMTKIILISMGNIVFLVTRKLMYSYINFKTEKEWTNNLMIIVMYAVIVWGFARGG